MGRKSRAQRKRREAAAPRAPSPAKRLRRSTVPAERAEGQAQRLTAKLNRPAYPQPSPRPLKLGSRSCRDRDPEALAWTCNGCGKKNRPRRCLVADIPVLECDCGVEADIEFDFSMGNITINDQKPIVNDNVKEQGARDCTLCATASNIEVSLRMRSILSGEAVDESQPILNLADMDSSYDQFRIDYKVMDEKWNGQALRALASIAKFFGVISDEGTDSKRHILPEFLTVKNNFYDIVRVLADGHPLTTGIIFGKKFWNLKPGKIYKAPSEEKLIKGKCRIGHAILLVGAGRRRKTNYYHFVNSWGNKFCVDESGRYGFGMVRASDIRLQPVKFVRFEEDIEHHKRLASTDLFFGKSAASNKLFACQLNEEKKTSAYACDDDFKSLQLQVRESNLLRESNIQVKDENRQNFKECQKFHEEVNKSTREAKTLKNILLQKTDIANLKQSISESTLKENLIELECAKNLLSEMQVVIRNLDERLAGCQSELELRERKLDDVEASLKSEIVRQKNEVKGLVYSRCKWAGKESAYSAGLDKGSIKNTEVRRSAYAAVLRAFCVQSDLLPRAKQECLARLRNELKILDTEHRECIGKAMTNKHIDSLSAWYKGNIGNAEVAKESLDLKCVIPDVGDASFTIHYLEQSVYASVLRAFYAQSDLLSRVEELYKVKPDPAILQTAKLILEDQERHLLDALVKPSEVSSASVYLGYPAEVNQYDEVEGDLLSYNKTSTSSIPELWRAEVEGGTQGGQGRRELQPATKRAWRTTVRLLGAEWVKCLSRKRKKKCPAVPCLV